MSKFNHNLDSLSMNYFSKTGSRNRIRIPVAGARHTKFKPGDKVVVTLSKNSVEVTKAARGQKNVYTVEKDGAVRFPAHKFNLPSKNLLLACDNITKAVFIG